MHLLFTDSFQSPFLSGIGRQTGAIRASMCWPTPTHIWVTENLGPSAKERTPGTKWFFQMSPDHLHLPHHSRTLSAFSSSRI